MIFVCFVFCFAGVTVKRSSCVSEETLNFETVLKLEKSIETFEVGLNVFHIIIWLQVYGASGLHENALT